MRVGRACGILLVLLLASPLSSGQWDQVAGGADRSGAAFLQQTALDVVGAGRLFDDALIEMDYTKGLVSTDAGLVYFATDAAGCFLAYVDLDERRPVDDCPFGSLEIYDRPNQRLILCVEGEFGDPVLRAIDVHTGEVAWTLHPAQLTDVGEGLDWSCRGTALVDGSLYVALFGREGVGVGLPEVGTVGAAVYAAQLVRLDAATGEIVWDVSIDVIDFYAGAPVGTSLAFYPFGLSVTDAGVIVSGRVSCVCNKADPTTIRTVMLQGAVAWFSLDGNHVGAVLAEDDFQGEQPARDRWLGQWWAATNGQLGGFSLGDRVFIVNPLEEDPLRVAPFDGIETGLGFYGVVPSAWWADTLLVPLGKSVTAIDPQTLETRWSWTEGQQWRVSAIMILPPNEALVAVASNENGNSESDAPVRLFRLALDTGVELQQMDLPETMLLEGGIGRIRFDPMADGRVTVYSKDGALIELGVPEAGRVPDLRFTTLYPGPNEPVVASVVAPEEGVEYRIAWGDGTITDGATDWSHRYGAEGIHTVRVTATWPDGLTGTATQTMRVGATPPPDLNPLQRAFAPENQDLTFGVLGLLVTLGGALIALMIRRRTHGRIAHDLEGLRRIEQQARADPIAAAGALATVRADIEARHAAGRLEHGQLGLLSARADRCADQIRDRLLWPMSDRLTAGFQRAVGYALRDGGIDEVELDGLASALEAELELRPEERERLLQTIMNLAPDGPSAPT